MEKIKIGDKLLVEKFFGGAFTATVVAIKKTLFSEKYLCSWTTNNLDYGIKYKEIGWIKKRNITNRY